MSNKNRNDFGKPPKNKMSSLAKIVSAIIVVILLFTLAFATFAFVDHSKKGSERLSQEQKKKNKKSKIKREKEREEKKKKKNRNEKKKNKKNNKNKSGPINKLQNNKDKII